MLKKPQNVYLPIDKFQAKVFKNADLSKRGEWVSNFALSLAGESNDDFAEELLTEAQVSFYKEKVRKWKNYIKNIICNENEGVVPTENEIYTRCCEEYGDEFVEAVELVESNLKKDKKTKKNTAGAPNGNNGDVDSRESANAARTTACENLGSGKPKAQSDQRRTGGHLLPSSSMNSPPVRSGAVDVLSLAYSGEFGNVKLTQEQYAQLGIKFGNQQKLNRAIDSLSCQIENGEKNPANHYAELVKWANYRDDMDERKEEEASKPKMTEMEKSWIAAMKRVEAM